MLPRLGESEMNLRRIPAEEARGDARERVLFLQHEWDPMRCSVSERKTRSIPTSADEADRRIASYFSTYGSPGPQSAANRSPVLPRFRPIQRMQIEQLEA